MHSERTEWLHATHARQRSNHLGTRPEGGQPAVRRLHHANPSSQIRQLHHTLHKTPICSVYIHRRSHLAVTEGLRTKTLDRGCPFWTFLITLAAQKL